MPGSLQPHELQETEQKMERRVFFTRGTAALACLTLSACNHYFGGPPPHAHAHGRRYGGPPRHAPAHGNRRKHHGSSVDLIYDSGLGVYLVVGLGYYFHNNSFYRWHDNAWQISTNARGPWRGVADHRVPTQLFKSKVRLKSKGKLKGKGKFKSKAYW